MKKILSMILLTLSLGVSAAETQKVCVDRIGKDGKVVMGKDGKPAQDCKEMKIHKKL